jgi:2-C-methyl-D-erythritol 4-phosphate cytidylyltransferase
MTAAAKPRVVAIVPAAGCGKRLGLKVKKPFAILGGRPLVVHALRTLNGCRAIDAIIVAAEKPRINDIKKLAARYRIGKLASVVAGGKTRFESVRNCLDIIPASCEVVVIHDGARPLVDRKLVEDSIRLAKKFGACIVAVPESDTVKLVGSGLFINKTLDRNRIFRAQTPQSFRAALIKKAYSLRGKYKVTDDASLVESIGKRVKVLAGSYRNMKITTREDLKFAEVLI